MSVKFTDFVVAAPTEVLNGTELMPMVNSVPVTANNTLQNVANWAAANTIGNLPNASTLAAANIFPVSQTGTTGAATLTQLSTYLGNPARVVATGVNLSANADVTLTGIYGGGAAGMYRISIYAVTTTAQVAASNLVFSVGFTDTTGGQTIGDGSLDLTGVGNNTQGTIHFYSPASSAVNFQALSGNSWTTGVYMYKITLEFIG